MKKLLAILLLLTPLLSSAEDLGTYSQTFNPDKDGRQQIKDLMRQKQQSGQLNRFWQNYRARAIAGIMHPAPLPGVTTSYIKRQELRDLRFTIPSDYRDQNGRIVVRKGTVIEPLKRAQMTTGLIFIDGRDPNQVNYAINRGRQQPLKIVLTAGYAYDLREKYKGYSWRGGPNIPFYFDQRKMIINSFKMLYGIDLSKVPVVLSQRGSKMFIEYGM